MWAKMHKHSGEEDQTRTLKIHFVSPARTQWKFLPGGLCSPSVWTSWFHFGAFTRPGIPSVFIIKDQHYKEKWHSRFHYSPFLSLCKHKALVKTANKRMTHKLNIRSSHCWGTFSFTSLPWDYWVNKIFCIMSLVKSCQIYQPRSCCSVRACAAASCLC